MADLGSSLFRSPSPSRSCPCAPAAGAPGPKETCRPVQTRAVETRADRCRLMRGVRALVCEDPHGSAPHGSARVCAFFWGPGPHGDNTVADCSGHVWTRSLGQCKIPTFLVFRFVRACAFAQAITVARAGIDSDSHGVPGKTWRSRGSVGRGARFCLRRCGLPGQGLWDIGTQAGEPT